MPNDIAEAYTTVALLRRYASAVSALETAHTGEVERMHRRYCSGMAALRNGEEYDAASEAAAAIMQEQERKFGKPIGDTSDAALTALGFRKQE